MARSTRWDYMSQPHYNKTDDKCPDCAEPSRTHYIGAKLSGNMRVTRYGCEHGHIWTERVPLRSS